MRGLNPASRGDDGVIRRLARLDKNDDLLDQRVSRIERASPTVAGGGIVDIANLSAVGGLPWPSGRSDLDFDSVTYGAITSDRDGSAVTWLSTPTFGEIHPVEEGFYSAWCRVRLVWAALADAPGESIQLYLNGGAPDSETHPVIRLGTTSWGVQAYVTNGPEWMTPTDYWRVEADGLANSTADIVSSTANWRITKYGAATT